MNEIGMKIKNLRIKNNETQKDLADYLSVTFQSISKWENGLHYPDVLMINKIAEHYNVEPNYFFDKKETNTIIEKVQVSVNEKGPLVVWTDFSYMDTIAPVAILDSTRHRAGNGFLQTHPGPKGYIIIAVDENNKICFFGEHINNRFPSCGPEWYFYSQSDGFGKNNPCFIIQDSYAKVFGHEKDFEFVIPKNGFLINIPIKCADTKRVMSFIIPDEHKHDIQSYFSGHYNYKGYIFDKLLANELNNISVHINDNEVIFEKRENKVMNEDNSENGKEPSKFINLISSLEDRINDLEERIEDLESKIEDLESEIDELKN